jgi:8-oxo-dGTP pyrophosphatase MutT (NUDIX family)
MMDAQVEILDAQVLSDDWSRLTKYTIRYMRGDGTEKVLPRETYDRGDSATILPYDPVRGTVLLDRQFRLTAWLNGHKAPLIEAAAGLLDKADPVTHIKAELEEELGLRLTDVR